MHTPIIRRGVRHGRPANVRFRRRIEWRRKVWEDGIDGDGRFYVSRRFPYVFVGIVLIGGLK